LFRGLVVAAALVGLMVAAKDSQALRQSGLVARCTVVAAPVGADGVWQACRPGKLEGRPDLRRRSCVSAGTVARVEYWQCPAVIASGPGG
jgi:hypothetical protein